MPLGWYLAQGLVPLGPSSSDDEEGPCELPNGRIVCGPHGLVICGRCCSDYTGMGDSEDDDDSFDDDDDDDEQDMPIVTGIIGSVYNNNVPLSSRPSSGGLSDFGVPNFRKGTGRVFPTKFFPPAGTTDPMQLFSGRRKWINMTRITHRNDPTKGLLLTDGACINNGQPNTKAGWAFQQGFFQSGAPAVVSGGLEKRGPFDAASDPIRPLTSNRAELRAIIAALGLRHWPGEGFNSLVVATDSAYAVDGATKHAKTWVRNGWHTAGGTDVKNRDLWEALLGRVEQFKDDGLTVHLWHIPREWNVTVDAAAKEAAATKPSADQTTPVIGLA